MCGINGILALNNQSESALRKSIHSMNDQILHRGPDDDGVFCEAKDGYGMALGMRRLSIIDLNSGSQPIFSNNKSAVILFNGEIYNYKELKADLLEKGLSFQTESDTEVILKLYEHYGTKAFSKLDGMFAFSILDKKKQKVYVARDYFGEKPLYYIKNKDGIYWGSELKSILGQLPGKPKISKTGLNLYFRLTYIPAPHSIYENIKKLNAGSFLEIDLQKKSLTEHKIDYPDRDEVDPAISFGSARESVHELVLDSVKSRSIADVPLGTFLSGGVDSSIVSLALAEQKSSPIDTFSIGFKKKSFDESSKAREVARLIRSNHNEFIIDEKDIEDQIDPILTNFDEPFADSSSLPTYLVANKTKTKVKVALTGDGGDEVFGGYNKYYMGKLNGIYTKAIPEKMHHLFANGLKKMLSTQSDKRGKRFKARKLINAVNYGDDFYYNIISLGFQHREAKSILRSDSFQNNIFEEYKKQLSGASTLTDFRNIDKLISLEGDMLVKVDRTSMLTSLESRAPFLNKKIWDFTDQLPPSFLMNGWDKKHILKKAFEEYFPKDFLDKPKKGFGVPVGDWLRGHLKPELQTFIEEKFLEQQGIFNLENIRELIQEHISGKVDNTFKVWTFYCFQKWYLTHYTAN